MPTPTDPEERWRALVIAVRAEFWNAGQNPNDALFTLFAARVLRGRLTDPPAPEEWFTRPVDEPELTDADPATLAREFYGQYRAARARHRG